MTFTIIPIQPVSGKKGNARYTSAGGQSTPQGFSALLDEMSEQQTGRKDGFSASSQSAELTLHEQEIRVLQRRIMQVNRLLLSFLPL